jgi:hypothetical protein
VSPRVREESVHPRLQSGASGRPLNFTVRPHVYSGARFIASAIAAVSLCACEAHQGASAEGAAKLCDADSRSGWRYLDHAPANADALRAALWKSDPGMQLHANDPEYWFTQKDGAYMRCTVRQQPLSEGSSIMCSARTTIFAPENTGPPPTFCIQAEK